MKRKILIGLTIVFIIALFIIKSYADSNSLTINYENNGTKFKIYNVEKFGVYNVKAKDVNAELLQSIVVKDNIKEDYSGVIENGTLVFKNIEDGYYLIIGDNTITEEAKYVIMPSLIKINSDISIIPKYEKETLGKYKLSVFKTWVDRENTHNSINVSLYENGKKIDVCTLDSSNGFKHTFENLDRKNDYSVFEDDIPEGYKLDIIKNGDVINLINTKTTSTPKINQDSPKEKLPQTGLLRWPILWLLISGIICIIFSFIKFRKIFLISALALITIAVILILNNETESLEAQNASNVTINQMFQEIEEKKEEPKNITKEISLSTETPEMKTVEIDGIEYIGTLEIPSQKLLLPVTADWSMDKLKIALCRYTGSIYTDDLVICGHNYTNNRHFGCLKHVVLNDIVYFRDVDNNLVEYKVVAIDTLDPYDINEMVDSDYDLTLFTCTYGGGQRLTIRANRYIAE